MLSPTIESAAIFTSENKPCFQYFFTASVISLPGTEISCPTLSPEMLVSMYSSYPSTPLTLSAPMLSMRTDEAYDMSGFISFTCACKVVTAVKSNVATNMYILLFNCACIFFFHLCLCLTKTALLRLVIFNRFQQLIIVEIWPIYWCEI